MPTEIGDHLVSLYLREFFKHLQATPGATPEETRAQIRLRLGQSGLFKRQIDIAETASAGVVNGLRARGVINPRLLGRDFGERLYFYLLDARQGKYGLLQKYIDGLGVPASRYVVFGPRDVLFSLYASPQRANEILDYLRLYKYAPERIEISEILLLHGIEVSDPTIQQGDINATGLNAFVEVYYRKEDPQLRAFLSDGQVLIGRLFEEDFRRTRRIRAFVGIRIYHDLSGLVSGDFFAWLTKMEVIRSSLRSVYKCRERFDFLLELVCDETQQLYRIGEVLWGGFPDRTGSLSLETETYIVGAGQDVLPKYVPEERSSVIQIVEADDQPRVVEVKRKYLAPLSEAHRRTYLALAQERQISLIQSLTELDGGEQRWFPRSIGSDCESTLASFARAVLDGSPGGLSGCITSVSGALEVVLRSGVQSLVLALYDELGLGQAGLGVREAELPKYSLKDCIDVFERAAGSADYRALGLVPDEEFLSKLASFKVLRNKAAHRNLPSEWGGDFGRAIADTREALWNALFCIAWVEQCILHWAPMDAVGDPPKLTEAYVAILAGAKRRRHRLLEEARTKSLDGWKGVTLVLRGLNACARSARANEFRESFQRAESQLEAAIAQVKDGTQRSDLRGLVAFAQANVAHAAPHVLADVVAAVFLESPKDAQASLHDILSSAGML